MARMFKLKRENDSYHIFSKKPFSSGSEIDTKHVSDSFEFAYNMSFNNEKDSRGDNRSTQKQGEVFFNAFQGKLSEYAFYEMASPRASSISEPDQTRSNFGIAPTYDFRLNDKKIAIMSTIYYGNLLLLELNEWNRDGEFIPNISSGTAHYDFFALIRLKPSLDNILRKKSFLLTDEFDKEDLKKIIMEEKWEYDFLGYVSLWDLKYIIKEKFILPKNSLLNGKTKMDADYYYIQGNNMRNLEELFREL